MASIKVFDSEVLRANAVDVKSDERMLTEPGVYLSDSKIKKKEFFSLKIKHGIVWQKFKVYCTHPLHRNFLS